MLGDFNIHMDKPEHPDTVTVNDFLESFDLVNYTTFPTHLSRHTLDLVITNSKSFYWCSDMKNTAHVNQLTSRVFPTICNITKI